MTARVGIGVVGLGDLGRLHAFNLAMHTGAADLRWVVDKNESTARKIGEKLDVPWSTSLDSILDDRSVLGVVIATRTDSHPELVQAVAKAGKHVFCEKPVGLDLASTLRAVQAATDAGIRLQVGFHRRFDPDWVEVRRRVETGDLGQPYFFSSTQREWHPPKDTSYLETDGDLFLDMLIHNFDCARWLFGDISEVTSTAASVTSELFAAVDDVDHAVIGLRFANGAIGVVDGSRAAGYGYESSAEIIGQSATARISGARTHNVEWLTSRSVARNYVTDFRIRYAEAFRIEMAHFAAVAAERCEPQVGGQEAIAAYQLAHAATRSHLERRSVSLPVKSALNGGDAQ